MDRSRFEDIAEEAFNHLPALFKKKIENVEIVVEDVPFSSAQHSLLLGLYHGVPLTKRGTWYGMSPVPAGQDFAVSKEHRERLFVGSGNQRKNI